eukprot:16796-Heterococcus_DN1.PRE.1
MPLVHAEQQQTLKRTRTLAEFKPVLHSIASHGKYLHVEVRALACSQLLPGIVFIATALAGTTHTAMAS